MGNENGTWIMHGLAPSDPACLHTVEELVAYVDKVGFLPLFAGGIPGFSVEEHVETGHWWTGNAQKDPWEWREIIARDGHLAYGKFFDKKAGFISREWFPYFANYRRDGYDFDALWADEKASFRQKKIMDCFMTEAGDDMRADVEIFSNELKEAAGFGEDGAKNFEGIVTGLQMKTYLCVRDFRQRKNKRGESYGWPIAVYSLPEHLWGYAHVASAYGEAPAVSRERIREQVRRFWPQATERQLALI